MRNEMLYPIYSLPEIEDCLRIFKAAAMLDAILMPEWEYRYYSFNSKWDSGEQMASMRDGEGEHYFAFFNKYGLIIKGYDQDYVPRNKQYLKGITDGVPIEFTNFLNEAAFMLEDTSFCLWRLLDHKEWSACKKYTEEEYRLLQILLGGPEHYQEWASEYYEIDLDLTAVKRIFDLEPLNQPLLHLLNVDLEISVLQEDLEEIGYPTG